MNKTLLFVVVSVLVVNFVEEHFNKDSFSNTFVSAEPINNRKDVTRREADVATEEDEDEVFVRVKRSPDPDPDPDPDDEDEDFGGGLKISTGASLMFVIGVIGGCLLIGFLVNHCKSESEYSRLT